MVFQFLVAIVSILHSCLYNSSCWIIFFTELKIDRFTMVFNGTFSNISVISWRLVLLVEETWVSAQNHRPAASHGQTTIWSRPQQKIEYYTKNLIFIMINIYYFYGLFLILICFCFSSIYTPFRHFIYKYIYLYIYPKGWTPYQYNKMTIVLFLMTVFRSWWNNNKVVFIFINCCIFDRW